MTPARRPSCATTSINVVPAAPPDDYAITGPLSAKVRAVGGRTYTLTSTLLATRRATIDSGRVAVFVPPDTTAPVIDSVAPRRTRSGRRTARWFR